MNKPKIVVIVGPTASGKTSLSIKLAEKYKGEIISADSRQVYRGLNIGAGKVTQEEMKGIPHHLLDVADPHTTYTVSDFVRDGRKAIDEIIERGNLPIMVGGTFFYVDALLGRNTPPDVPPNEPLRSELETKTNEELFSLVREKDPIRADGIDKDNKRRLIRALEIIEAKGSVPPAKYESMYDALIIGIDITKDELMKNIDARLRERFQMGMIDEVKNLMDEGITTERFKDLGLEYRYISEFLEGTVKEEELHGLLLTKSMQYAKRQMTWLNRDKDIVWIKPNETEMIESLLTVLLKSDIVNSN